TVGMTRPRAFETVIESGDLVMRGRLRDGKGMTYAARLRIVAQGGKIIDGGKSLRVLDASSVLLLLAAQTDYNGKPHESLCLEQLDRAAKKSYKALCDAHLKEHRRLFRRVSFSLGSSTSKQTNSNLKPDDIPTDAQLEAVRNGANDTALIELYFQFGRYLL